MEASFQLMAPIAVTFKVPRLPDDFQGAVHKFKKIDNMCKRMFNDYSGFERTPDSIEPKMYYVCLVILENYEGQINYKHIINNIKYDKLAAYYIYK